MRIRACFYMASRNFLAKRRTMAKLSAAYAMVIVVVLCLFSYRESINLQLNTIVSKSASACYVETSEPLDLADYPAVTETKIIRGFDPLLTIDQITLTINDSENHVGVDDYSYDFVTEFLPGTQKDLYSVPFKIDAYSPEGVIFSAQDRREFTDKNGEAAVLIAGDLAPHEGGIILSDYMLQRFGLAPDKSLIGSRISMVNPKTGEVYCQDLTLIGIIDSRMFYTETNRFNAQIIIAEANATEAYAPAVYRYYGEDYSSTYRLALAITSDNIRCRYNSLLEMYNVIEDQQIIVGKVVSIILVAFFAALPVSVLTVLYFYYQQQKNYRQMQRAMGMKDRDVFACALLEQLYCLLAAAVIGTLLAQVLIMLVNVYFSEVLSVRIDVRTETMFLLLFATTGALLVFTAVVTGISSWRLSRESIAASLSQ